MKNIILLLMLISTLFLFSGCFSVTFPDEQINVETGTQKLRKDISGNWVAQSNVCFQFNTDGTFNWYKSYDDMNDNYYTFTYDVINSREAINALELDYSDVNTIIINSEGKISYDDFFYIKTYPTYAIVDGVEKSESELENLNYEFLFIKVSDTYAEMLNYSTGLPVYVTKK